MSRPLRIEYPGAFYHVTSRGNERKSVFMNDRDREKYLSYLESAHERYGAKIHVYCLMGNHYHLLLETPRGNLSQILHHINGAYTTYFNVKRERSGHLFQGRYKGILVDKDEYCKELSRYIHLNPVRAGIVKAPLEYRWSSYRFYVGKDKKPKWLTTELILDSSGGEGKRGFDRYKEYVEKGVTHEIENPLKGVVASAFLGSKEFIERIREEYLEKKEIDPRNISDIKRIQRWPSFEDIERAVAKRINREERLYRKTCIYMSHQYSGLGLDEVGRYFGMKAGTISQLSRRFKESVRKDKTIGQMIADIKKGEL